MRSVKLFSRCRARTTFPPRGAAERITTLAEISQRKLSGSGMDTVDKSNCRYYGRSHPEQAGYLATLSKPALVCHSCCLGCVVGSVADCPTCERDERMAPRCCRPRAARWQRRLMPYFHVSVTLQTRLCDLEAIAVTLYPCDRRATPCRLADCACGHLSPYHPVA